MSIMKMRESEYDTRIREFRIARDGVEVTHTFPAAEAVLTGQGGMIPGSSKSKATTKKKKKKATPQGRNGGRR